MYEDNFFLFILWFYLLGSVIKGWDIGVATMKKGERAILTCASEYAYGASGSPPTIPPDSTLKFDVSTFTLSMYIWKNIKGTFDCQMCWYKTNKFEDFWLISKWFYFIKFNKIKD